jgi:hypothetical protein
LLSLSVRLELKDGAAPMTTDDALTAPLAFYQKASLIIRFAIVIAFLWPIFALVTAMVLAPMMAQTIVPLVEIAPVLLAIVLLIIGTPSIIAILLDEPIARKGFLYFVAFIGVELTIGIYIALVPISNDAGLVPLLIITGLAIFFLQTARFAKPLRNLLIVVLIGITITFAAGGRTKLEAAFTPKQSVVIIDNYPPASRGSKPQVITQKQPSSGPINTTQTLSEEPEVVQQSTPPKPKTFNLDWSAATKISAGDFTLQAAPCMLVGANLHCFFKITNENDASASVKICSSKRILAMQTQAYDNEGLTYLAERLQLGDATTNGGMVEAVLPPSVPVRGSLVFPNFTGHSVELLEFNLYVNDSLQPLPARIRHIAVTREAD